MPQTVIKNINKAFYKKSASSVVEERPQNFNKNCTVDN